MQLAINEFIEEQRKGLAELFDNLSKSRVAAARNAARQSAARIKALNTRVRELARSGVRLTAVSQGAAQGLIELHADIVNTALTEAAAQIERMAYTESVRDLARMQAEVLQAARQRIVEDMARAVTILKDAAGEARSAVTPAKTGKTKAPGTKPATRRKAAAKPKAKAKAKAKKKARVKAPAKRAARKTSRRR